MDKVTCPTFIVHGQLDKLIPISHAYQLKDKCSGPTFFLSPPNMTHNDFDFYEDLIRPLMRFLCQINILQTYEESDGDELEEPTPNNSFRQNSNKKRRGSHGQKDEQVHQQLKFREDFFIPPMLK